MLVVAVMYPASPEATFDFDYYVATHCPLVQRLWSGMGLQELRLLRGKPGPDGAAPTYVVVAMLTFASDEAFGAAAAKHGKEVFADIPHFTNIKPVIQFNSPLS